MKCSELSRVRMNRGLTVLLNNAHFKFYLCASFASPPSSPKPSLYWSLKTLLTLANVIGIGQGIFLSHVSIVS